MANNKYRWFKFLLWEDNEVHMSIFDYLKSDKNPYQGCYIRHEPEKDEKKPHYHVVLYFPTPRTCEGVAKSFGKCNLVQIETEDGTIKKQVFDTTGYADEQIIKPCDCIRYITFKDDSGRVAVADNSDISQISDIRAWADYMLHKNFESLRQGKIEYGLSDIKPFHDDFDFVPKMFEVEKISESGSETVNIITYIKDFDIKDMRTLLLTLHMNGEHTLMKFVESHAYLIKNLL